MPTYEYRCTKCEHQFEVFHGIKDRTVRKCPRCGSRARKVPAGGAGLIFRGSGFYITDYRSKDYKEKAKKDSSGGAAPPAEKKSDGGKKSSGGKSSGGE